MCKVEVEFIEDLPIEHIVCKIIQMPNPHVIIWYIGCYGLKTAGVQFYKDFLFSPVLSKHTEATFWLVDLTAWSALKKIQSSIQSFNSACDIIESIPSHQIKCIKSSQIFMQMQKITENNLIVYFKRALSRHFISESSQHFQYSNIRLGNIFSDNCSILSNWYNHDTNKAYSIIQYLEGHLIIDYIISRISKGKEDPIQIVFTLPNDELKYYRDTQNSFQNDLKYFISSLYKEEISINIKFLSFNYGFKKEDRPYNAPGGILKKCDLSYAHFIDLLPISSL
ncbi:hypothetical protein [Rhabdochlamydiaceae symbiont of Dictyostelium giganteum]|uniref:hypothetical protein n=1 Tax=Rhabdochlamydiaceae symbiont of Dictyostelium giganteum TaxID=3342349 RepID=UPI0038507D86